ncbi:hypothetical protein CW751_01805 [Brumimicrobium salinarum]|uniref:Uncharacterized protein n=1 Tax=Brumimicrobium salinarum TaxID=2058658 RepID=A0A2I0R691_9FLAO|nr:hypothetical protein CW751_01805 [Brumimicrobium salinarum]
MGSVSKVGEGVVLITFMLNPQQLVLIQNYFTLKKLHGFKQIMIRCDYVLIKNFGLLKSV